MTPYDDCDDIEQYVRENRRFLSRILLHGNEEARGYAIALLAVSEEAENVDVVMQELENLRSEGK